MHFANSTPLHGRKHAAHVDMAPPIMGSIVAVSYREKDLLQELGGHKFTGNHSRSTDYIHGMESQFTKLKLTPYATGIASVIVDPGNGRVRFADAERI